MLLFTDKAGKRFMSPSKMWCGRKTSQVHTIYTNISK